MATLQIKSVQLTEPLAGGPDEIVIVVELPSGDETDFMVQQPRGLGGKYIASLGVSEYRKLSYDTTNAGGRKRVVPKDELTKV